MSSNRRNTYAAWIALVAVFFSGISSALATLYFQDRPDIIAEICTNSGIMKTASTSDGSGNGSGPAGGKIYCAQCLSSAAQQVIIEPPIANLFAMVAGAHPVSHLQQVLKPAASSLPPPSRGPPQLSDTRRVSR